LRNIFVHVQIGNEDAKTFWQTNSFGEKETIKDYYKKNIEGPRDAWLLEREIDI
jgi:ribosomal protein S18 acetylase RimI-like enzyme